MTREVLRQPNRLRKPARTFTRRGGALAMTGVLLLGPSCTDDTDTTQVPTTPTIQRAPGQPEASTTSMPEATTTTTLPLSEMTVEEVDCSVRNVAPGEFFNPARSDEIDQELKVLEALNTEGSEYGLEEAQVALRVINGMRRDPQYAEAITKAQNEIHSGNLEAVDSVEEFLNLNVGPVEYCPDGRITADESSEQLRRAAFMSGFIISETVQRSGSWLFEGGAEIVQDIVESGQNIYDELQAETVEN